MSGCQIEDHIWIDKQVRSFIGINAINPKKEIPFNNKSTEPNPNHQNLEDVDEGTFMEMIRILTSFLESKKIPMDKYSFVYNYGNKWKTQYCFHIKCVIDVNEFISKIYPEDLIRMQLMEETFKHYSCIQVFKDQIELEEEENVGPFIFHKKCSNKELYNTCKSCETNYRSKKNYFVSFVPFNGDFLVGVKIPSNDESQYTEHETRDYKMKIKYIKSRSDKIEFGPIPFYQIQTKKNCFTFNTKIQKPL